MSASDQPAPPSGPRNPVAIRLVVAPIVLGVILGVLWLADHNGVLWPIDVLMGLFGAGAGYEMALLLEGSGRRPSKVLVAVICGLLAGVGLLASAWVAALDNGPEWGLLRYVARTLLLAAGMMVLLVRHLRDTRPDAIGDIAAGLVPMVYVGFLLSCSRELAFGEDGARRLVWFVLIAKASDMGGWIVGKTLGRHKMIPSVSPGKTWEGTAGGVLASVLVAVLLPGPLGLAMEAQWSLPLLMGYGVVLAAASILAGVTQSGWKRRVGVKDSSSLIPEMGGLLDMVDSLLFAGPVAWLWYYVVMALV